MSAHWTMRRPIGLILAATAFLAVQLAGAAEAATLSARPSTVLFDGTAEYEIDLAGGFAAATNSSIDGAADFFASGFFDAGTLGDNPSATLLLIDEISFDPIVDAIDLAEVEIGAGFVALLFDDIQGSAAGAFTGGNLLAILRDPAFPATMGEATYELRRLDDLGVIPLPAAAPLMVAGIAALVLTRRRRTA